MHLAATVVAAATHAEEEPHNWHEDGEQQAHRCTYEEAYLIVDGLGSMGEKWKKKLGEMKGQRGIKIRCFGCGEFGGEEGNKGEINKGKKKDEGGHTRRPRIK